MRANSLIFNKHAKNPLGDELYKSEELHDPPSTSLSTDHINLINTSTVSVPTVTSSLQKNTAFASSSTNDSNKMSSLKQGNLMDQRLILFDDVSYCLLKQCCFFLKIL